MKKECLALLLTLCGFPVSTGGQPTPATEINARQEVPVRAIAVDPTGKLLVTASRDGLVHVWDLGDGKLVQTLRPPGTWGDVLALAISPDGTTLALGGRFESDPGEPQYIFLFDLRSGEFIDRLGSMPSPVQTLVFRSDEELVALLGPPRGGVHFFFFTGRSDPARKTIYLNNRLEDCNGSGFRSADFAPSGRLVTTCGDGLIRLYEFGKKVRVATRQSESGRAPRDARFSPDGKRVAVIYGNSRLEVLSGETLKPLVRRESLGPESAIWDHVVWPGERLFVAGRSGTGSRIAGWPVGQQEPIVLRSDLQGSVVGLRSLPGGRILLATSTPGYFLLDDYVRVVASVPRLQNRDRVVEAGSDLRLLPPVLTVRSPAQESEVRESPVPFQVAVRSPSGEPITAVRFRVDGSPVDLRGATFEPDPPPPSPLAENVQSFSVPVPSRDCTVTISAETRFATSEPVAVKIRWTPPRPSLYVLAVGVGDYKDPGLRLAFPAKDARDVAAAWKTQAGQLYDSVEVRALTDREATRDAILGGLEWLEERTTERDVAVLFFAGHGINDPRSGNYLFLPWEADLMKRRTTLLPDREVTSVLAGIPGKALAFFDTCHAGNLLGQTRFREASADLTGLIKELSSAEAGVVVFAAATGRQASQEADSWSNGAFTRALLEALAGAADRNGDHILYVTEIEGYLAQRVRDLTGGLQTPIAGKPGGAQDFPLAIVPGSPVN